MMSGIYKIFDDQKNVVNQIIADKDFVEEFYPDRHEFVGPLVITMPKIITKVAFRFRFTDEEFAAIISEAKTDPEVQVWYDTFNMVTKIDLNNQRTKDGVAKLVSKDLLTQARADEILTAAVQQEEVAQF